MTFAVGDKVLILAKMVPGTPYPVPEGTEGVIDKVAADSCVVSYFPSKRFWFGDDQIILSSHNEPFLQPVMELDEIELAEKIMEGLK